MNQPKVSLKRSTVSGCLLSAAAWVLFAASPASAASVTLYNDTASFLGGLQSSYLENFNSTVTGEQGGPLSFSGSGYSYSVDTPGGSIYVIEYPSDPRNYALSTIPSDVPLVFTFGSGVEGVGGSFFLTDDPGNTVNGSITITLNDGTTQTLTNPGTNGFNGFISSGAEITSLTITSGTDGMYPTVDNLYVGAESSGYGNPGGGNPGGGNPGPGGATPEPASVALFLSGLAASAFRVYKKRTV
jgi:hypothetical protein